MAISLDGWTSSNNYGFLAIIAHYIHPVTGELGMSQSGFYHFISPNIQQRKVLLTFVSCLGITQGKILQTLFGTVLARLESKER